MGLASVRLSPDKRPDSCWKCHTRLLADTPVQGEAVDGLSSGADFCRSSDSDGLRFLRLGKARRIVRAFLPGGFSCLPHLSREQVACIFRIVSGLLGSKPHVEGDGGESPVGDLYLELLRTLGRGERFVAATVLSSVEKSARQRQVALYVVGCSIFGIRRLCDLLSAGERACYCHGFGLLGRKPVRHCAHGHTSTHLVLQAVNLSDSNRAILWGV